MKTKSMSFYALTFAAVTMLAFTNPLNMGKISFDKLTHDFGQIVQGVPQKVVFTITNQSDEPLILTKVKGSCGCTATAYSKEPISPGEKSEIEATYNAKSPGVFNKTITLQTNLEEEPRILKIQGEVVAPPDQQ